MPEFLTGIVLLVVLLGLLIWWAGIGMFALWTGAVVGTLVLSLVALGLLIALLGNAGFLVWVGGLITALTIWVQMRRARQRALLKLLALAVEKGMPLPAVVRAMAADERSSLRWSLSDLADHLDRGVTLSAAAEMVGRVLSPETIVAAQMGEATGDLSDALKQIENSDDVRTPAQHTLIGNAFYLAWPILFLPVLGTYLIVAILPQFIKIADDFQVELPWITVAVAKVVTSSDSLLAGFLMVLAVAAALVYLILCYVGIIPLPTLGFGRRLDRSRFLRGLSLAVGAQRPLGEMLSALARCYPSRRTALRLEACSREITAGGNWIASLTQHRLIGRRDAAVAESAQRVGNLPWALRELADSKERRLIYQLEAGLNVVAPLILLVWGGVIFIFAVAFFMPLVAMISSLT